MSDNSTLNKARYSENTDEWYTDYATVESEVSHYVKQFEGKTVLCNCDDPYKSAFTNYFLRNFNKLGLKKLICTSYKGSRIVTLLDLVDDNNLPLNNNSAYVMIVESFPKVDENTTEEELTTIIEKLGVVRELNGDGDFRSDECVAYLQESDIVVTNPPFSKFIDLFTLLVRYDKRYLLIGNQNAITYKEIFPYIKNGQAWIGYRFGDMAFKVPR